MRLSRAKCCVVLCGFLALACGRIQMDARDGGADARVGAPDAAGGGSPDGAGRAPPDAGPRYFVDAQVDPGRAPSCGERPDPTVPVPDYARCARNEDCMVASRGCCEACPATFETYVAIRRDRIDAVCPDGACVPPICPGPRSIRPSLAATCAAGECQLVEVARCEVSRCSSDADCVLRARSCCGCLGTEVSPPVALHVGEVAAYEALVCDPARSCGSCASDDGRWRAACVGSGHCDVIPR